MRGLRWTPEFALAILASREMGDGRVPRIVCIYTGSDGQSHFVEAPPRLHVNREDRRWTGLLGATGWMYAESKAGPFSDWHTSAPGGFSVMLEGCMEMEVGGGERQSFGPGDILIACDVTGQGHRTRMTQDSRGITVTFAEDAATMMRTLFGRDLADHTSG